GSGEVLAQSLGPVFGPSLWAQSLGPVFGPVLRAVRRVAGRARIGAARGQVARAAGVGGMVRGNGKAAALLGGVGPGIRAGAARAGPRRGVLGRASPSSDPAPGARGKPLPAEVLERFRLPPDAEERLRAIGMPADDSPIFAGPRRRADTPELAAAKLVIWA